MDKFYVLDLTNNLDSLESDYNNWMNLPYDFRMRSDDECIKRFGLTNYKLYEKMKSNISQSIDNSDDNIITTVSEDTEITPENEYSDAVEFIRKINNEDPSKREVSIAYNEDPNTAIVYPGCSDTELEEIYNKYCNLISKYKKLSNGYSMSIWGYNVPNMYIITKSIHATDKAEVEQYKTVDTINIAEDTNAFLDPIKDRVDQYLAEDNKLGLLRIKLDSCDTSMRLSDKVIYEDINRTINKYLNENDFSDAIRSIVPYFTIDEMNKMGLGNYRILDPDNYFYDLREAMTDPIGNRDRILAMGWNPSVELTNENIEFARQKQIRWANKHCPKIVDVSMLESNDIIIESSSAMRRQYDEKRLYPVYIVLSYNDTLFGNIIRKVTKSTFTHAGIALDSDLKKIYTFKYDTGTHEDGARVEDLSWYLFKSKDAIISVFTFFVGPRVYKLIKDKIEFFMNNADNTKYSFTNIVNILLNRSLANDPMNMSMVCSQFVDTILRVANVNLVNKTSNLVIPQDFYIDNNPKVYKVYEGYVRDYKDRSVEKIIAALYKNKSKRQLTYKDTVMEIAMHENDIDSYYINITDDDNANDVMDKFDDLLLPEEYICEKALPIKVDDKTVTIEFKKSLEDEYQDAHRLLLSYNNENLTGIKHELARLYYIVITIEKKIKTMKKHDTEYKSLINLRARCLNDFKKYFKVINKDGFDFYDYYKTTEYNTNNLTIDTGLFSFTGKLIGKLFGKK